MNTPTLITAAQALFAARDTAEEMAGDNDYLAALVLLNEAVEKFQGAWTAANGVAPAFYHPDGRQADGDEHTCDGPAGGNSR